jgi:formate hydrogenlyase subunit 3/multisubunit Na+/H+ antiporter MnhD subunit
MKKDIKFWALLACSISLGILIAWIDSRPNWDDTGVTAAMILVVTVVVSYFFPQRPFIWALAVSIWIPLLGIISSSNYGSLMALLFGFVGAYLGWYSYKKTKKS